MPLHAASLLRLDIDHNIGVMQRRSQQQPALVSIAFVNGHPPPLVVVCFHCPRLRCVSRLHPLLESRRHPFPLTTNVPGGDPKANLHGLLRLFEGFQELGYVLPAVESPLHCLDHNLQRPVRPVVEEIVLPECTMSTRLHHQRAIDPRLVQLDPLVDYVLVPFLEPEMLAPQPLDETLQSIARARVCDNRGTWIGLERDRGSQCNVSIAVDRVSVLVNEPGPVNVRVKHDSQVGRRR
mmetsp:Transcript_1508/g.4943  ORF Transcript_1508/g.4943 Transcript_1508/m.4943 type:complete len:237 (+) Transcript_1508:5020-5730(+)